jgi:hypothetical protein
MSQGNFMHSSLGMYASFYYGFRQDIDAPHGTEKKKTFPITKAYNMRDTGVCKCGTQILIFSLSSLLAHFKKQKGDHDKWNCCRAERFSFNSYSVTGIQLTVQTDPS